MSRSRCARAEDKDAFEVAGRGELQLGVLIETMRREGFELSIGRPRVLFRTDPATGQRLEPIEEVHGRRRRGLRRHRGREAGPAPRRAARTCGPRAAARRGVTFHAPSRGLIGYHGEFLTDTRGTGVMSRLFHGYAPYKGPIEGRRNGVLISNARRHRGRLCAVEPRGARADVHRSGHRRSMQGMIIGEHSRGNDLDVNPLKGKQLTNIRTTAKDEAVRLTPPRPMTLEQAIAYIEDDELVEVTPKIDPPAQEAARPERPQARRARRRGGGRLSKVGQRVGR